MACIWCSGCFNPENEDETKINQLREMVEAFSGTRLNHLISHIEDGLNDMDIANPPQNTPETGVHDSTKCGRFLVNYVMNRVNGRACKVCFLQKLGSEARKVESVVLKDAPKIRWVAVGLSVAAYMMDEMKNTSADRSMYVQPLLYMLGLLKSIKQQNTAEVNQEMLNDAVHFIVLGSLLCILRMQSKNRHGFFGLSASVSKADMHNLEFRLGGTYPEFALGKILEKFPSAVTLPQEQQYVNANIVGIEKARDEVIQHLGVDSGDSSRIAVVIHGQDGIGKTTIANAVLNRLQLRDHEFSKVEINHECSEHDIKILQQQLIRDLFGKSIVPRSCVEGRAHLSNAFRETSKPVFIFIDNVQKESDIDNLLPGEVKWLPVHSRILITSRDRLHVSSDPLLLNHHYAAKRLEHTEAKKFLQKEVLGSVDATFSKMVGIDDVMRMCDYMPLALRIVASYLVLNGDHVSACKNLLESVERYPPAAELTICRRIVDFMYHTLDEPYKEAFLDIAIFFNNWDRLNLVYTFPDIQLKVLEEAGLITISPEGKLFVHDVVTEQAKSLSGKARITNGQGLKDALQDKSTLSKIKGIWLSEGLSEFELEAGDLDLTHKSLRILYLGESIKVSGECRSTFAEVRFFHICNKPMNLHNFKRVSFFHGSIDKQIDFLDLTRSLDHLQSSGVSELTRLPPGLQLAKTLHVVELSHSPVLDSLPEGFTFFSALAELDLSNCVNLRDLPDQIGQFKSLSKLKLTSCPKLKTLPGTLGDLSSLEEMDCTDCSNLVDLPASFGKLQSLYYLQLRGCSQLVSLPESFGDLSRLEELDLSSCRKLESLPDSFHKLISLSQLHLQGCSELKALPQNIGNLSALEDLDLSSCSKLERLERTFEQLEKLLSLHLQECSNLSSLAGNIGNLSSLEELDLSGCDKLESLPETFGKLNSLRVLKLSCSKLIELPVSMGSMSSLQQLTLIKCDGLASLPNTFSELKSIYRMHLKSCSKITEIPLPSLEELEMTDCSKLIKLPDGIEQDHDSLRVLKLYGCSSLPELPSTFGRLPSMEDLVLNGCTSLKALPESFRLLKSLRHLRLRGASQLTTKDVALFPTSLETIDLSDCTSLERLPNDFGQHKHLIWLFMDGCFKLHALPGGFEELNSLRYLSIAGCTQLEKLGDNFVNLTSLEALNASGCRALEGKAMDQLVEMKRLKFADIRKSPSLVGQWETIQGCPLLVMCSDAGPDTMYAMYRDVILRILEPLPFVPSSRKAIVWLQMCHPDPDQHASEIKNKVNELKSKQSLGFMRVAMRQSDDVNEFVIDNPETAPWDEGGRDPKICQTLAYAILGLWKLWYAELFNTLAMLKDFLVMIDIQKRNEDAEVAMEAIIPAFQNGGYQDVDFQRWVDPKGGFIRIFSPFVSLDSKTFGEIAE